MPGAPASLFGALLVLSTCACGSGETGAAEEPAHALAADTSGGLEGGADAIAAAGVAPSIDPGAQALDLSLPSPDVALPEGLSLRVVSWNLHGGGDASEEAIGQAIASWDADLVLLQESPYNVSDAVRLAAGFGHMAAMSDKAILANVELVDAEVIDLGDRDTLRARATWAETLTVSIYSVHIGWNVEGDQQAAMLVDELKVDPLGHKIVGGDFNDEHGSTQITRLEELLAESFTVAGWHPSDRISWPATEFDGKEGSQLIDLIFTPRALGALVEHADVLNLDPPLSDHKPSLVDLRLPLKATSPFSSDPFWPYRDPWRVVPPEGQRPPNLLSSTTASTTAPPAGSWSEGSESVDLGAEADAIDEGLGRLYAWASWRVVPETQELAGFSSNLLHPQDHGEVVVVLRDGQGLEMERLSSGPRDGYVIEPGLAWVRALDVPPGARTAELHWVGHCHPHDGSSCDVLFEDLYLGLDTLPAPHARLAGNLLVDPGAEASYDDPFAPPTPWEGQGWRPHEDLSLDGYGFSLYPPRSWSGHRLFYGADRVHELPGLPDAALTQTVALDDWPAVAAARDAGELAVRWGGHVRTLAGGTDLYLRLELLESDGGLWHAQAPPPVRVPEWWLVEHATKVPPGITHLRLVLGADLSDEDTACYADDLFVRPERHP